MAAHAARPPDRRAADGAPADGRGRRPAPTAAAAPDADRLLPDSDLPAPRRDHHGRQPALGPPARPGRARGPRRRRRGDPDAPPPRGPARRPGRHRLRLQPRELGPLRRRGRAACSRSSSRRSGARPPSCKAQGVRIRLLGRLDELPDDTRRSIGEALAETAGGDRLLLNVAFNYAGRTELVDAVPADRRERRRPGRVDRRDRRSPRRSTRPACPTRTS